MSAQYANQNVSIVARHSVQEVVESWEGEIKILSIPLEVQRDNKAFMIKITLKNCPPVLGIGEEGSMPRLPFIHFGTHNGKTIISLISSTFSPTFPSYILHILFYA